MYMTKYDVFCTVFENGINNITILTTENYTGVIKNTVFSSSMSNAIFFPHKLVPRLRADFLRTLDALHIPSTHIFKMAAKTAKTDREQMKKAILTVDS